MYKNIELINLQTHKNSAVKAIEKFHYAQNLMSTSITAPEFFQSCKDYPIVFIKDNNNWVATVMLGYEENKNIYVNVTGQWEIGKYLPASIRRYPFVFVAQAENQLSLGIDSSALSTADEDKERRFFTDEDKPSEYTEGVLKFMNQFQADAMATSNFIEQLEKWELLEEGKAQVVTQENKSYQIDGFFIVNEEKLQHLSKKKKQEICDENAYPLITAHLISLSNIQRMGLK